MLITEDQVRINIGDFQACQEVTFGRGSTACPAQCFHGESGVSMMKLLPRHRKSQVERWVENAHDMWAKINSPDQVTFEVSGHEVEMTPHLMGLIMAQTIKARVDKERRSGVLSKVDARATTAELTGAGIFIAGGELKNYGLGFPEFEAGLRAIAEVYRDVLAPRAEALARGQRFWDQLQPVPDVVTLGQRDAKTLGIIRNAATDGLTPAVEFLNMYASTRN